MSLFIELIPHTLHFKFAARTSRGALQQHQVYYLKLYELAKKEVFGLGECAPLPGLSPELTPDYLNRITELIKKINSELKDININKLNSIIYSEELTAYPALVFGLETAAKDLVSGGNRVIFNNWFSRSEKGIPINGLIWMGDKQFMLDQIKTKLQAGFSCLKLKIGGLDFATELSILAAIREVASAIELIIRLDANGAFAPDEAQAKLDQLSEYNIQSIEQPIRAGQWEKMHKLCQESPVPVALDEELIGINTLNKKIGMLENIKPPYIILKPTLLGGLAATAEWIELAQQRNIKWWVTSALESNIGLNAISQFTAEYVVEREQGLGTGQLYHNNIPSPLRIAKGNLYYDNNSRWDLSILN